MDEEKWVKYHWIITIQYDVAGGMRSETWNNVEDFRADLTDREIFDEILRYLRRSRPQIGDLPIILFYRLAKEEIS